MLKNAAGQRIAVYAWDAAASTPKTGHAASITATLSLDGATPVALTQTHPVELGAVLQPGVYLFDLTQAETNADHLVFHAQSSDPDVLLDPLTLYTRSPSAGGGGGDVNVTHVGGTAVTGPDDLKADVSALATATQVESLHDISVGDILDGTVDGTTVGAILEILLAAAQGRLVKSGDTYTYYKQDNVTALFTNLLDTDERTRA